MEKVEIELPVPQKQRQLGGDIWQIYWYQPDLSLQEEYNYILHRRPAQTVQKNALLASCSTVWSINLHVIQLQPSVTVCGFIVSVSYG